MTKQTRDTPWEFDDGASRGLTAETAMGGIVGGEQPTDESMSPDEMAAYLDSAPTEGDLSYDDGARLAGRVVLTYLRKHPEARKQTETYEVFNAAALEWGNVAPNTKPLPPLDQLIPALAAGGLTRYTVGWAVNAARYAFGDGPVRNPAMVVL